MPRIRLTESQLMALRDLVAEHLADLNPNKTEVYIDVLRGVETTPGELLLLLMDPEADA